MRNTFKKLALAAAFAGLLGLAQPVQAATVGEPAPDFTLKAADGADITLSSFKGKVVVLEWFNKECPFVRKHYDSHNMQNLQKEMKGKDVVWLTINSSAEGKQGYEDAAAALETVTKEDAAPAHVLLDPQGMVGKLYDAKTTPHMFVINQDGALAYAGAIDSKSSVSKDDIATSQNYVRDAVTALLAGETVKEAATKPYGCGVKYAN